MVRRYAWSNILLLLLTNSLKVVEDTSSYLNLPNIETTQHIGRNHIDMCRFTGLDDIEYKKVAVALSRISRKVSRYRRKAEELILNEDQRQALLDSLRFDQIDSRQMSIRSAHVKTCTWLLKKPEYLDWLNADKLNEHHGFLWMKGKPGTGKLPRPITPFTPYHPFSPRLILSRHPVRITRITRIIPSHPISSPRPALGV